MKHAKWFAGSAVAAVATLLWPGPAGATTTLSGYTAAASASVVHIEVFEPTIPIPASPQGDFSVGYSSATAESGSSRATASYLWPGSVVGDGFDQLTSRPGTSYPVQVNSRYPATSTAPKTNHAQLTKSSGMSTAADDTTTTATVTGLGIYAPDTDPTDGIGDGLGQLGGGLGIPAPTVPVPAAPSAPTGSAPKLPVPVPAPLAELVSVKGMTSTSQVVVGTSDLTSTAESAANEVEMLGGIITLENVQVVSTIVSDGTKATNVGKVTIGGLELAGHKIDLGKDGFVADGTKSPKPPAVPKNVTQQLAKLGISFTFSPAKRTHDGAEASYQAEGMIVSIDTAPLRSQLDNPLNTIVKQLGPDAATQLAPLLALRPKLVLNIGEATNDASASPAYVSAPIGAAPPGGSTGGTIGSVAGSGGGSTGGLGGLGGTTAGTGSDGGTGASAGTGTGAGTAPSPSQQAAFHLPGLGAVPKFMILGALVLAGAIGWALQTAGGALLGGAGPCQYGLRKGVPNLRNR